MRGRRALLVAALTGTLVTGLLGATTSLAGADHEARYSVTASPLRADGLDHSAAPGGPAPPGALWLTRPGDEPTHVTTDGVELPMGGPPPRDFHAALVETAGGSPMTLYLEARLLSDSFGGPYDVDCRGVEALLDATTSIVGSRCVDLAATILAHDGSGHYVFGGYDGFDASAAVGTVPGFAEASVTVVGGGDDGGDRDRDHDHTPPDPKGWYVSAAPLAIGTTDYVDSVEGGGDEDGGGHGASATEPPTAGANWLVPDEHLRPQFVTVDDTPLNGFPSTETPYPVHVVIASQDDGRWDATVYVDGAIFALAPGGPYPTTCAGLVAIVTAGDDGGDDGGAGEGEEADFTCVDFKANVFLPPPTGPAAAGQAAYTFTGLSGFENASAVRVVTGFSPPRLTFGPYAAPAPVPGDPPTRDPVAGPGPAPRSGAPGTSGPAPILPATGAGTAALFLVGAALVGVGVTTRPLRARHRSDVR